jgi:hypothetical protein
MATTMHDDTKRSIYITWGLSLAMLALSWIFGGPYWGVPLLFVGIILVLHGHFPRLFASVWVKSACAVTLAVVAFGAIYLSPLGDRWHSHKPQPVSTPTVIPPPAASLPPPSTSLATGPTSKSKSRSKPKPKPESAKSEKPDVEGKGNILYGNSPPKVKGDNNIIVTPTDADGNVNIKGNTTIGNGACSSPGGVVMGTNAGCPAPINPPKRPE